MIANGIELFCGKGIISDVMNQNNINCKKIDIRKRKGKCMPDLQIDVLKLKEKDIYNLLESNQVFFMWLSIPCDIWSYASGGFHLDSKYHPKTIKAKEHIKILKKSLALIEIIKPKYWFIENPRGHLRYYPKMIDFLVKNNGITKEITLSSYGFPTTKPTNIFTNAHDIKFKELHSFGRGAKSNQYFNNMTKSQRQSLPIELAIEIKDYLKTKL